MSRELTRQEKTAIRKLVTKWCANYDKDYGCLPLDCPCYMLGKCWTGTYCRYFRAAVLPLDPVLERSLTVERITETRPCPVCGRAFLPDGRQRYCSTVCAGTALREQHPDLFRRALALEDNARQNLKTVKGLGRNYSWRERFGKEFCTHGNG